MINPVIGIDASRAFAGEKTGTENYSYQLIRSLVESDCQLDFRLYTRPGAGVSNVECEVIDQGRMWTQYGLAKETWLNPPDLLFIPAHVVPFFKNPAVPAVVTVHDLRTEFLPQHESLIQKVYLNKYTEVLRSRLAAHMIAVSESTKRDLVQRLGVDPGKVTVVYEGVDHERFNNYVRGQRLNVKRSLEKYAVRQPYILFIGTIQPRKNLVRLTHAFSQFVGAGSPRPPSCQPVQDPKSRSNDLELILAGGEGWNAEEIYAAPRKFGVEDKVKFIGYVEDRDLPYLYAGAEVFAFPSLYEGFGLPVLEAMAVGTPVLTSNVSSLPEVGGEAVYYVNPEAVSSIVDGLSKIMTQSELRDKMVAEGYRQVQKFSWQRAASQTCEVFRKLLNES